jgi:hypothetical protein
MRKAWPDQPQPKPYPWPEKGQPWPGGGTPDGGQVPAPKPPG